MPKNIIGVDVGGSHVSAAIVGGATSHRVRCDLDSALGTEKLVSVLHDTVATVLGGKPWSEATIPVALSMPGPFDYRRGVFRLRRGQKYGSLFGLDLAQTLNGRMANLNVGPFYFFNDAQCFALGDRSFSEATKSTLALTLGTGLGSSYVLGGRLRVSGNAIPPAGYLYGEPYRGERADEWFSTRGLIRRYKALTGKELIGAKELHELALSDDAAAVQTFAQFGMELAEFLAPWISLGEVDRLRLGGNISRAGKLFLPFLAERLDAIGQSVEIGVCDDVEGAALKGAALLATECEARSVVPRRKTSQNPLPRRLSVPVVGGKYDLYPVHDLGPSRIQAGLDGIADLLANSGDAAVIDGYQGVFWTDLQRELDQALRLRGIEPYWLSIDAAFRPVQEIESIVKPFEGEPGSIFGKRFIGRLVDFFDPVALGELRPIPGKLSILYGCGAAVAGWVGPLVYVDLPKNELQFRQRARSIVNLGLDESLEPGLAYKRSYFIDWIALNAHKCELLPRLDALVDGQREDGFSWIKGSELRTALHNLARLPLRVRPWFEPGVWGGEWLKEKVPGLNQEVPNYAWSFELITPENGLVLSSEGWLLEVSFDLLLFQDHRAVLGQAAERFGTEFPLRFDFLDTWNGGNLSIQVHPTPEYMRRLFGENFTQDETYYILDAQPEAKVYLGLKDGVEADSLANTLQASRDEGTVWPVEDFVQVFPARQHDLFLIPHGAIHGAGRGNVVLEISSTPYIYTFKLYDWQRPGLDGKPRPLNLHHGLANLDFSLQGENVGQTLLSKPVTIAEGAGWQHFQLPTHERHFYRIERYDFEQEVHIPANGHCYLLMLVAGDQADLTPEAHPGMIRKMHYAETVVVPSAAGAFKVTNRGPAVQARLIVAHVKEEACCP